MISHEDCPPFFFSRRCVCQRKTLLLHHDTPNGYTAVVLNRGIIHTCVNGVCTVHGRKRIGGTYKTRALGNIEVKKRYKYHRSRVGNIGSKKRYTIHSSSTRQEKVVTKKRCYQLYTHHRPACRNIGSKNRHPCTTWAHVLKQNIGSHVRYVLSFH